MLRLTYQAAYWRALFARPLVTAPLVLFVLLLVAAGTSVSSADTRPLSLFLVGLVLVVSAAVLRRPETGAPILLFLLFTRLSDVYAPLDWRPSPTQVAVGLVLLSLLLHRLLLRRGRLTGDRVLGWMLVYAVAILLSAVAAYDRITTLAALVAFLREAVIAFLLVNLVTTMADFRLATWALVAGGFLLSGAAVLHAVSGYDFGGLSTVGTYPGSSSPFLEGPNGVDSNYFAQLLLTVVPLALYRAWDERRPMLRLAALGTLALLAAVIVWTHSRGGFLGLVTVLCAAVIMQHFRPARLLVLGVALAPAVLASPELYRERLASTAEHIASTLRVVPVHLPASDFFSSSAPLNQDKSGTTGSRRAARTEASLDNRTALWRLGLRIFIDHPLTGAGKGNYLSAYQEYASTDPSVMARPMAAHSTPVQIAAETGLLGLMAFGAVVAVAVLGLRRAKQRLREAGLTPQARLLEAVEIAIYGYLVTSVFLHDNTYQRYLWLLVGLAAAGRQLALRSRLSPSTAASNAVAPVSPK